MTKIKKYIYKIENLINHKIYIGQTNNIKRRFQEHKNKGYYPENNKVLYQAFDKYGLENFSFDIIEETEKYNEREKYWIKYYNSYHFGYNMTEGGDNPPTFHGEEHPQANHLLIEVENVKNLLKNSTLSVKEIAKITNYNTSSINRINQGTLWYDNNETYPLRKNLTYCFKQERANKIKNDLLNTKLSQKEIAKKYNVCRSTVTAINLGQNFKDNDLLYPLRK